MADSIRVLGIDASLRSTGLGVVEAKGTSLTQGSVVNVRSPQSRPRTECLKALHEAVAELIRDVQPVAIAIESAFYAKNAKTSALLGEARGAAISACAICGIPVYEYEPRRVKKAIVGNGAADKTQVRKMVMTLLNITEEPQEDVGDALALAICHLHNRSGHAELMPGAI
jgi:crossover junction endodeoxyribonuclease RuvC